MYTSYVPQERFFTISYLKIVFFKYLVLGCLSNIIKQ